MAAGIEKYSCVRGLESRLETSGFFLFILEKKLRAVREGGGREIQVTCRKGRKCNLEKREGRVMEREKE